jgi:hypothetical protein
MTSGLIKLIGARDKAYKNGLPTWKTLRALTQRRIRTCKRAFIENKLNSNQNTKEWWATLKSITKPTTKADTSLPIIENRPLSFQKFCNNINTYYVSVGGEPLNNVKNITMSGHQPLQHLSIGETKRLLSRLDPTKATSGEDYPTWVSLEGREDVSIPLCDILNEMLTSLEYPNMWKRAQVNPIPKTPSPSKFKDCRPISLLFHLGKVAEDVIINKMRGKLEEIIEPHQYAYQHKLGTVDALIQLLEDFSHHLDKANTKFIQSAALDFSKAFDRLQPSLLISKMQMYGFAPGVTTLVADFLRNRVQSVKYGGNQSEYITIKVGAPQGTKLGPILWLIYSNDLMVDGFQHMKYADDTTLYKAVTDSNNHSVIAQAIYTTQTWSEGNNMMLNAEKTVVMNTTLSNKGKYDQPIELGDTVLHPSTNATFLGIVIDHRLSFNDHVQGIMNKCNSRLFLLRKLKSIGLSEQGLKLFYLTSIRSIISYAAPAWYSYLSKNSQDKLEQIQATATKVMVPGIEYEQRLLHLNLPTLNDHLFQLSLSHFYKISENKNHPLHSRIIYNTSRRSERNRNIYKPPRYRTTKCAKSFFNFFMTFLNSNFVYVE